MRRSKDTPILSRYLVIALGLLSVVAIILLAANRLLETDFQATDLAMSVDSGLDQSRRTGSTGADGSGSKGSKKSVDGMGSHELAADKGRAGKGDGAVSGGDRTSGKSKGFTGTSTMAANIPGHEGWDGNRPQGELSIAGFVIDELGQPVAGIPVNTRMRQVFDAGSGNPGQPENTAREVLSDNRGAFAMAGLPEGDFEVRTGTLPGVTSASTVVRAGSRDVKLVVAKERDVVVYGQITTPDGKPVGNVQAVSSDRPSLPTLSDAGGNYGLTLKVVRRQSYRLQFQAEGFQVQSLPLSPDDLNNVQQLQRNVVLKPAGRKVSVTGIVKDIQGQPVAREAVYLQSSQPYRKYQAVTDPSGRFAFSGVDSGQGYYLWLRPQGPYKEYQQDLTIPNSGVNNLAIVLKLSGVGRLTGRMVDAAGNPVPNFTLQVLSRDSARPPVVAKGDGGGQFVVDNVPTGLLNLETTAYPRFIVSGLNLAEGEEQFVNAVLDIGAGGLQGRVVDEKGYPVSAANITLSWVSREGGGLVYESMRQTVSDAAGQFAFGQVGPGTHTVIAQAPGFQRIERAEEVGGASGGMGVELQLARLATTTTTKR